MQKNPRDAFTSSMPDSLIMSTNIIYIPVFQSAYRPFHSTETAIACILNDMIGAVNQGHVGALMLLDLSAAFDTVDHQNPHWGFTKAIRCVGEGPRLAR